MWLVWLILSGFFFIGEIITTGFLIFWLGVGALVAMIVSFFVDNLIIQIAVFVVVSIVSIILTKPFVNKFVSKKTVPTNAYSVIGKTGIVTKDIDPVKSIGQVKIEGEVWSAKCNGDDIIPKGTEVKIKDIEGVKVIVQPCTKESKVEINK